MINLDTLVRICNRDKTYGITNLTYASSRFSLRSNRIVSILNVVDTNIDLYFEEQIEIESDEDCYQILLKYGELANVITRFELNAISNYVNKVNDEVKKI